MLVFKYKSLSSQRCVIAALLGSVGFVRLGYGPFLRREADAGAGARARTLLGRLGGRAPVYLVCGLWLSRACCSRMVLGALVFRPMSHERILEPLHVGAAVLEHVISTALTVELS
jgi:hypothetical protein